MGRGRVDLTEAKLKRQQRNQRYRDDIIRREHDKERDKLYQQKRREQARLRQHQDPLARLADVATQREYLGEENDVIVETVIMESEEGEETNEVSGMVEEEGEILETLPAGEWEGGFNDDLGGGFDDGFRWDMNENGMNCLKITNCRGE